MMTAPTVLLASADRSTQEFSALLLRHVGLRVEQAHSAEETFRKTTALRPDAIVVELGLPDVDAITLRERIRTQSATRAVPMLIVNGSPKAWLDAVRIVGRLFGRPAVHAIN